MKKKNLKKMKELKKSQGKMNLATDEKLKQKLLFLSHKGSIQQGQLN